MTKYALYVPLEAKPGKEKEVADFLAFRCSLGECRDGHDFLVRHPGGTVIVRHF